MWLWHSRTRLDRTTVDLAWQAFLRRFDIEHTFRMLKHTLGWTTPTLRDPEAADRWTWLLIAAYTQLRLTRGLAADLRRPWEKPTPADRLSPARVRRVFRHIRPHRLPGGCPETLQTWPWPPSGTTQPPACPTP